MNKKDYRQMGIFDSKKSMQNLIEDLQNANSMFSPRQ